MNFLFFPLFSGILYAVGSLLLKRALARGVDPWRMAFLGNIALAVAAIVYLPGSPSPGPGAVWWQPVLAGAAFFVGQVFTFQAIDRGDLSVATPIMGTKVLFVALFLIPLTGVRPPWTLWLAGGLTTVALALLGSGQPGAHHRAKFLSTALCAVVAAASFSFADAATQKWAPHWGAAPFSFYELGTCALLSPLLIPRFSAPLTALDRTTWGWLAGGVAILAVQGSLLYVTIGTYGHAAEVNVVYNSRGLWTVLLVWAVGHWFANTERHAGRGVMVRRLLGALLLLAAIGLVAHGKTS